DARDLERETRDARLEDLAGLGVHLVGSFHRAEWRREHGAAGVAVRLAALQRGLLADDARSLHLLDVPVAVGDDPVAAAELGARRTLVLDDDRVGEGVAAFVRRPPTGPVPPFPPDASSL